MKRPLLVFLALLVGATAPAQQRTEPGRAASTVEERLDRLQRIVEAQAFSIQVLERYQVPGMPASGPAL